MSEYESAWTINCGQFASIALFTVDFLDTLPLEVNTFWGGNSKISLVKILYFVSRYGMLLMMAMQLWFLMSIPVSENACAVTQYVYFMFVELPPTCASALLLIRAWAICSRNRLILGLGIVLMLFPPVYDFYEFFGISSPDITTEPADESFLYAQCTVSHLRTKFNRKIEKIESIGYPGFELAFDTLVFVAILSRTYKLILETRRLGQKSIIEQIAKDGALYYFAVLMAQGWDVATSIATFRNNASFNLWMASVVLCSPLDAMRTILANRLVLNARTYDGKADSTEKLSTISFRIVGTLDAPLRSILYSCEESGSQEGMDQGEGDLEAGKGTQLPVDLIGTSADVVEVHAARNVLDRNLDMKCG